MKDIAQGTTVLNNTIAFNIKHPDYDRVTALATEYHDIFTGANIKDYLRRYRKNESDESFNQMLEIFETTIPATVNNLSTTFEKPLRSNRIFNSVDHDNNTAREEILDRMKTFWQGETESGLDAYLRERWKHLVCYDPNAFIAVEFNAFNPVKEKPTPFAVEYSSAQAIRPNYIRGVLDYLICEVESFYETRKGSRTDSVDDILDNGTDTVLVKGSRFIMYLENDAMVYTEVDKVDRIIPAIVLDSNVPYELVEIRKDPKSEQPDRVFAAQVFDTKSEVVPAFRVGYLQNPQSETTPRTCLSNIHHALAFFKKELKSGAELDLTIRGHVFPQKYMYGPRCEGDKENGKSCNGGKTANGDTCEVCGGTGALPVHTTATDVIILPTPKKAGDPVMDLRQAMAYFSPPIELVRFMVEYCDRLTEKAKGAIFNSQAITTSTNKFSGNKGATDSSPTTATEQDYSWDNVYDTYRPFTAKYSYAWLFITKMIAIYTDNIQGFKPYHKFPSDYKLKPVKELMGEAEAAKQSDLPQHVLKAIHEDIANVYYADDPDTLTRITIKNKFHPFSGKSESEVQAILMSEDILPYYRVLYIYFDIIFDGIDEELGDDFYLMTYQKQKAEVQKRVDTLLTEIEKQKAKDFKEAQKQLALTNPLQS